MEDNPNQFSYHYKLEDMVIDNNINMKEVYNLIKTKIKDESEKEIIFKGKKIQFYNIKKVIISFNLNGINIAENILRNPIKIKTADESEEIDIISESQVIWIRIQNNISEFFCKTDNEKCNLNLINILDHESHEISLVHPFKFQIFLNQDEMDENLKNYKTNFIQKTFKTPEEFEKNFKYYFKFDEKINLNNEFTIFEDQSCKRQLYVQKFLAWGGKQFYNYYGASGKGKSITLIGALKYNIKGTNKAQGTFYVNCKALRILIRDNKIQIAKQIFIDEILFLFNNYDYYNECCKKITDFKFVNEYDFWSLVEIILDYAFYVVKGMKFIIAFDQYNNENDINNNLQKIQLKYSILKNFKMLIFSSMNESDIRQKKIDALLNNTINFGNYENQEIKEICSNFLTDFTEKEQEVFNKLGHSLKSYNEIIQLRNIFPNDDQLEQYICRKKNKIKYKIFLFYEGTINRKYCFYRDKITDCQFDKHMGRIFSFIPETNEYTYNEISKIIENISFRFFDVVKTKEDKYIINFSFQLVEEIFIDIYRSLILQYSFNVIQKITHGSGAFGCLFEYAVIFFLIEKLNKGAYNLFNYFSISKNLTVKKFVLNKNEIIENIICKVQKLDEKFQYIIDQEVFCGKTLDFIIIRFIYSIPNVYGFQISIFKKDIYKIEDIQKSYESMKKLLEKYFGIRFNKFYMYFGYIFNYSQINTENYSIMLNKCQKENLKYCFYDPFTQEFKDNKGNQIRDIKSIVTTVFETNKGIYNSPTLDNFVFSFKPIDIEKQINDDYRLLNEKQKESLSKLIKDRLGKNVEYKFITKSNIEHFKMDKFHFFIYLDNSIPFVSFFYPMAIYKLYNNGGIEKTDKILLKDELYIYEIFYSRRN